MKSMFIVFVEDHSLSKKFYQQVLEQEPILDVPGMTEFALGIDSSLGLMPASGIVKILENKISSPVQAKGIP